MKRIAIGLLLAMVTDLTYAEDGSKADECLKEAIRVVANAPHVATNRCEAVMVEGMWIAFTNSHGEMKVTAGKGFERSYTWAGATRSLVMWQRNERWYGSLGMYNPGSWIEGEIEQWKEHEQIGRCVAEEGQRHFTNTAEAVEWIRTQGKHLDYVYNDTGLVVGMSKEIPSAEWKRKYGNGPGTLSVDVWQIYINGKRPQALEGAKNQAVKVFYPPTYDMETVTPPTEPVDNFYPPRHTPALSMDEQLKSVDSAPPSVVKTAPRCGESDVSPTNTEIRITFSKNMADKNCGEIRGQANSKNMLQ